MKRVKAVVPIFFIFLLLSILILLFSQNPLTAGLQFITLPLQKWTFNAGTQSPSQATPEQQLQQENNQLRAQLAQMQELQKDNQALHDQFKVTSPASQTLLPAEVIGIQQNALLIDKGENDHLSVGNVVVVDDNLIGKVSKITPSISVVTLLGDPSTSFTAETAKTSANGIVKSQDGTVILGNVVLTDKLQSNDIVMTKGSMDSQGNGYPPKLIVGKIVSVDKQASSLFQSAKIESLVNIPQLRMVFVETR